MSTLLRSRKRRERSAKDPLIVGSGDEASWRMRLSKRYAWVMVLRLVWVIWVDEYRKAVSVGGKRVEEGVTWR